MPVYVYACQGDQGCGNTREQFFFTFKDARKFLLCDCGRVMTRDLSKEGFNVQADIEPGYNESIGMHVSSRADFREKLKHLNAFSPDIPKGNPTGGLTPEERRELETGERTTKSGGTIFEKRRESGWGAQPDDPNDGITVEGEADYAEIRDTIRKQHVAPKDRRKPLGSGRSLHAGRSG